MSNNFIGTIPSRQNYRLIERRDDRTIWQDIDSLLVRIVVQVPDPWRGEHAIGLRPQWSKGDQERKLARIDFAIRVPLPNPQRVRLERVIDRGRLSYCGPAIGSWHVPLGGGQWLIYFLEALP